jgi:hypothetical protein
MDAFAAFESRPRRRRVPLLRRLAWWRSGYDHDVDFDLENDDDEVERRESYALDEVDAIRPVPKARNANYHKRVSL